MFQYIIISFLSLVLSLGIGLPVFAAEPKVETPSTAIVIFGATGDLTAKKLAPALYHLAIDGKLAEKTAIVGIGRRDYSSEEFRKQLHDAIQINSRTKSVDDAFWNHFQNKISYQRLDFDRDEGYEQLSEDLKKQNNRVYYLATQPSYFPQIVQKLSEHGLIKDPDRDKEWSRIVIEKPFGSDLDSAIALQKQLSEYLDESQIYRIDHFLGKEGIQNLISFRFEDSLFEPLWNNRYIDHVQITLSEDIGIGTRANFWEETGLLRDLFQNHLMQILALVAMEPPSTLQASDVHAAKIKLLNAIQPFNLKEVDQLAISGQYDSGNVKGIQVSGYRQEKGVPADSLVETFAAAKLSIDNERWKGVPFYLRAGKRLPAKTTEIAVVFKGKDGKENGHTLFIRIQPDAGIFLRKFAKNADDPRPLIRLDAPSKKPPVEAYEKLLADCIQGNASLFVQADEQIASWRLWTPLIDHWQSHPPQAFPNYKAGTWGPKASEELVHWEILEISKS